MVFSQDTMGVADRRDLLEISGSVGRAQFWELWKGMFSQHLGLKMNLNELR